MKKRRTIEFLIFLFKFVCAERMCSSSYYFDNILKACKSCDSSLHMEIDKSITSVAGDYLKCKCKTGYRRINQDCASDTSGNCQGFTCTSCFHAAKLNFNASYTDNSGCAHCGSSTSGFMNTSSSSYYGDCTCPSVSGYPLALIEENVVGTKLSSKSCQTCPSRQIIILTDVTVAGKSYQSDPYTCQSCPNSYMSFVIDSRGYSCDCDTGYTKTGQASLGYQSCIKTSLATTFLNVETSAASVTYHSFSRTITSLTLLHYFVSAATYCQYYSGPEDISYCQLLANLCVLQLYNDLTLACSTFKTLMTYRGYTTAATSYEGHIGWGVGLPWLYYSDNTSPCKNTNLIKMKMNLNSKFLEYYVAIYTLNGTWIGYEPLNTLFSYCGTSAPYTDSGGGSGTSTKWQIFGSSYQYSYQCNLASLLLKPQYFYELFLLDSSSDIKQPIPVVITNLLKSGASPNSLLLDELCSTSAVYVRRFFLYDIVSGISSTTSATTVVPQIIRYASQITLNTQIQINNPELIYTPILTITYTETSSTTSTSTYGFDVWYSMDLTKFKQTQLGFIIFAIILTALLFFLRYYNWNTRHNRLVTTITRSTTFGGCNSAVLLELLFLLCHSFVMLFTPLLILICFYWFVFFKLQVTVAVLLPPLSNIYQSSSNYFIFILLLHLLFFFQLFSILRIIIKQSNADIFFIDWEPPIATTNKSNTTTSETKVSVWRSILVANEYSELQTERRLDLKFTLFWLGFILIGMNLQYNATQQPDLSDLTENTLNPILRFSNTTWWWLLLLLLQYLFVRLIYQRFLSEPKEQMFIDFCTIAKVSIIVLDEPYHGYYLHCRSPHQHADGTMADLVEMLHKEEAGLTVDRSLSGAPEDIQCFELFLSSEFRVKFDKIFNNMSRFMNVSEVIRKGRNTVGFPSAMDSQKPAFTMPTSQKLLKSWKEMTIFLQEFVENNLTPKEHQRVIVEKTFRQRLFGFAPNLVLPGQPSIFAPDKNLSYIKGLLLGVETDMLLLNLLSYSVFDLWFGSTAISILLCYLLDEGLCRLRQYLGQISAF